MLSPETTPDDDNGPEKGPREITVPDELMRSLRFKEFELSVRPKFSIRFRLNGYAYHFDGVVRALAAAHNEGKVKELEQFAQLPGLVVRLCYGLGNTVRDAFTPESLVRGSRSWREPNEP